MQRAHHRARQVFGRVRVFLARWARLVIVIVHEKRQRELVGKILDILRPAPENRPGLFVNALQMIEKIAGRHAPRQPKTRAIRDRAIRDYEDPALVIPNALIPRERRCVAEDQESGSAASRVKQQAHQEFLATSRNLYSSLEAHLLGG